MIYILAALVPPLGLLLNGQPFSAIFNLVLVVFCLVFGLIFHVLLLVPSGHAIIGDPDEAFARIQALQAQSGGFGGLLQLAHNWADFPQTVRSYELINACYAATR